MERKYFKDLDLDSFWEDSDYFTSLLPITDELIKNAQAKLGYILPPSYIEILKTKNGGTPVNDCFPTDTPTSWADNHISISGILGIGGNRGIDSVEYGSRFMIEEWGYPDIGIVFCDCPSAGHDAVMFDYSQCGIDGEPQVIHVDVEINDVPTITFLAKNFEEFIRGLINKKEYDNSEERLKEELEKVKNGEFSKILSEMCKGVGKVNDIEFKIRNISKHIVDEKGFFALHADMLSYLMYDIQFWLYTKLSNIKSKDEYLKVYPNIIVFGGEFSTGGYAEDFVVNWFNKRIEYKYIENIDGNFIFTEGFESLLVEEINKY